MIKPGILNHFVEGKSQDDKDGRTNIPSHLIFTHDSRVQCQFWQLPGNFRFLTPTGGIDGRTCYILDFGAKDPTRKTPTLRLHPSLVHPSAISKL